MFGVVTFHMVYYVQFDILPELVFVHFFVPCRSSFFSLKNVFAFKYVFEYMLD